jgi:dCMP deaminase
MKKKFKYYFMEVAEKTASLSYAKRLQVGTVIVKDNRIISCGYNGLPAGWTPNACEEEIIIGDKSYQELSDEDKVRFEKDNTFCNGGDGYYYEHTQWKGLKTFDEVIHSEANAVSRLASSTESGIGAILFCTHSPCLQCSKIIYGAGITSVYYKHDYRKNDGIEFLRKCGIEVLKI